MEIRNAKGLFFVTVRSQRFTDIDPFPRPLTQVFVFRSEDRDKYGKISALMEATREGKVTPLYEGEAVCSPKDKYIKRLGFLIAANRALKNTGRLVVFKHDPDGTGYYELSSKQRKHNSVGVSEEVEASITTTV